MRKIYLTLLFILLGAGSNLIMSQSSYSEDFSGELDENIWISQQGHTHSIVNEELVISVDKRDQSQFFRISFADAPMDLKENPVLNFRIRTPQSLKLTMEFYAGAVTTRTISVPESDQMVPVSIDLSDVSNLNLVNGLNFINVYVNRTAVSYNGTIYLDDFVLGNGAVMHSNIGGLNTPVVYAGESDRKLLFKDISNASSLAVSGAEDYIENVRISPIFTSAFSNTAYVMFDVKDGVEGTPTLMVTAVGSGDYADNTLELPLQVVSNMPPEMDQPADMEVQVGNLVELELSGISDGDDHEDQELQITVTSSDQSVIADGNISVTFKNGSPYATLGFTAGAVGGADLVVNLDDGRSGTVQSTFHVDAYASLNLPPVMDPVEDQIPYFDGSASTIVLTGVGDGNGNTQGLNFTVSSSVDTIVNTADISISDYNPTEGTALLTYTPVGEGATVLTLTLTDDGAGTDNGNKESQFDIVVKPVTLYATGHDESVCIDPGRWSGDSGIEVEATTFDGSDVLKVSCTNKWIWGALNFNMKDTSLNLTEHPFVSMEIYSVDNPTLHWLWFYDDWEMTHPGEAHRNDFPSVTSADGKAVWAEANQWTTVVFDFSGENEMSMNVNDEPVPINSKRIVRILYNYHDQESAWPRPPEYTGTFYIRNMQIGDKALMPDPPATVDPVADQVSYVGPGPQSITVSGLSDGKGGLPQVAIESDNAAFVDPVIGAVQPDGTAQISYDPADAVGEAKIALTISATGSVTVTDTFLVKTMEKDELSASGISIDMSQRFQEMEGMGTYMNEYYDLYTEELGATAMRVGIISNQIEPVNDNNDPYVLNRSALNYNAFNWDAMRRMKEQGVETFILTSWSAPGWMKDNHSESWYQGAVVKWEEAINRTSPFYYEEWAEYFVAAYRMFEEEAGIQLAGIGIQNEPAFYEPYPSAVLSPEEFAKMVAVLGKRLEKEGIECKIFMPEQVFSQSNYSMSQYMDAVFANPDADRYTDIIAVHGYAADGIGAGTPNFSAWTNMYNHAQEGSAPKGMWMTETHKAYNGYDDAMWIAMAIYGAMEYGNIGLWTQWGIVGQHIINGKATSMLHAMANFSRFIRPGAVRVQSASSHAQLFPTTWVDEERGTMATVIINNSDAPVSTYLSTEGKDALPATFGMYLTTSVRGCEFMGNTADSMFVVPANSVITLVGRGNKAPVIDQVPDQLLAYDGAGIKITLTGIDAVEEGQDVVAVEASSDNTTLLPVASSLVPGPGGTAELNLQPAAGQSGEAEITVKLSDNGSAFPSNTSEMHFRVQVYDAYNQAPIVEQVPDQYHLEDEAGTLTVGVTALDGDDGTQALTGSVETDNPGLFQSLAYDQGSAQLTYELAPGVYGEANVKLTVSDDGGSANNNGDQSTLTEFRVMVAAVNDAPEVTPLGDQSIDMNSGMNEIQIEGLSYGDPWGPSQTLSVSATVDDLSLVATPVVKYYSGTTARLQLTPILNQVGTTQVTVLVEDNGGMQNGGTDATAFSFTLSVVPTDINQAPVMTPIMDQQLDLAQGALSLDLLNVDDGDADKDQTVTITASSSDESVVEAPVVNWVPSLNAGKIKLTPLAVGTSEITITLQDNGGTDFGGVDTREYSFTANVIDGTGVADLNAGQFGLYPNPAGDHVRVLLPASPDRTVIRVMDLSGRVLLMEQAGPGEGIHTLDLEQLAAGSYLLEARSGEESHRTVLIKK